MISRILRAAFITGLTLSTSACLKSNPEKNLLDPSALPGILLGAAMGHCGSNLTTDQMPFSAASTTLAPGGTFRYRIWIPYGYSVSFTATASSADLHYTLNEYIDSSASLDSCKKLSSYFLSSSFTFSGSDSAKYQYFETIEFINTGSANLTIQLSGN